MIGNLQVKEQNNIGGDLESWMNQETKQASGMQRASLWIIYFNFRPVGLNARHTLTAAPNELEIVQAQSISGT